MNASFLVRIQRRFQQPTKNLELLVVSHGGSGSTLLAKFLHDYIKVNSPVSTDDGLLHCSTPDHPLVKIANPLRIVYVYDDPRLSVLSLFRRNLHLGMQAKLRYFGSSPSEYRRVSARYRATVKNLDEFFEKGYDCFGINSFWQNWTRSWVDVPLMLLSYDAIWQNLGQILEFSGVSEPNAKNLFPKQSQRAASLGEISSRRLEIFNSIYSKTLSEMDGLDPLVVRGPI